MRLRETIGIVVWVALGGGCGPAVGDFEARSPEPAHAGSSTAPGSPPVAVSARSPALAPSGIGADPLAAPLAPSAIGTAFETTGHYAFQEPLRPFASDAPAQRLANLSDGACRAELVRLALPVVRAERAAPGVAQPLRVTGPMRGVRFVTAQAPSPFGVLDCHLALALDELAGLLANQGVTEVFIGSMYRKGARIARRPFRTSQHARGLGMDVVAFRMQDGRTVTPERDWHAAIGDTSCGPDAVMVDPNTASIDVRNIYCAVARSQLFHHLLGPSANPEHHDHFHFDIERGTRYASVD